MNPSPETLWARLITVLRRHGRLPPGHEGMTPAELARRLAAEGDDRVGRLVWDWYYPRRYGDQPGSMTDEEAQALIDVLDGKTPRPARKAPAQAPEPTVPSCSLCGGELA